MKFAALRQGLVGAWCPSLGPSGNTLLDRSGYGNHGTLTNMDAGTDWVGSRYGWALDFDAVNDYVDIRQTLTGVFTVSMWAVRRSAGIADERILWGNLTSVNTYIADVSSTFVVSQSDTNGSFKIFSGFTFPDNVWFHLVVVRDANNGVTVFKDGRPSSSGTQTINGIYTLECLGRYASGIGANQRFLWDGQIDDIRVYNRAFTQQEIQTLGLRPGIGLLPKQTSVFFGAQLFNVAWAKNSNQLISAGVI